MPPLLVELAVGVWIPLIFVGLRAALVPILGDRAPYAFNFLAVVCAAVLAGWRGGLVALLVGQAATWVAIVQPQWDAVTGASERLGGFLIASVAELLTLAVIILYQREITRAWAEREKRLELLHLSLQEIDHRTRNNYQTVLALIQLQAQRAPSDEARLALQQVADRITALSVASERLAMRSEDLGTIRLADHLRELCAHVERGLSRDEVRIEHDFADVTATADKATYLSIIVNELVTNALKHAFGNGRPGVVRIETQPVEGGLELIVADNGEGIRSGSTGRAGLGRKLIDTFVRQLGAEYDVRSSKDGTTHRIMVPGLA